MTLNDIAKVVEKLKKIYKVTYINKTKQYTNFISDTNVKNLISVMMTKLVKRNPLQDQREIKTFKRQWIT